MLLLFLDDDAGPAPGGWWRLDDTGRRLTGGAALSDATPAPGEVLVAVAPAAAVTLHKVALPRLAPAQAQAAARAMAMDLSAASVDTLHTALGQPDADGQRWLAIADTDAMAGWVARLDTLGLGSATILPAPLLLPENSQMPWGQLTLVHSPDAAFAAEPDLAALMLDVLPAARAPDTLASGLITSLPRLPNLRQGRFALKQPWRPGRARLRRLAGLAAAAGLALLLSQAAGLWQHNRAADAAEARLASEAAALLPPGTLIDNPALQVQARLAQLGGGPGLTGLVAPLMAALEARPGLALASLEHASGQGLRALIEGASPGEIAGITADLRAAGLVAEAGLPRVIASKPVTELKVRAQ